MLTYLEVYKEESLPVTAGSALPQSPNPRQVRVVDSCGAVNVMANREPSLPPLQPPGSSPTTSPGGRHLLWLMGHLQTHATRGLK